MRGRATCRACPASPAGPRASRGSDRIWSLASTCITPKPDASLRGTSRQPTVTSAPCSHVLLQHQLVVHLVDVVAGEQHDVTRIVALDDVDVLIHRVRRAEVPLVLGNALARRQDVEAFVALGAEEVPAALQVPDQAVRLVLGRHRDAADAGIQRVGQREIDDARSCRRNTPPAWRAGRSVPSAGCRVPRRAHRPSRDGRMGVQFRYSWEASFIGGRPVYGARPASRIRGRCRGSSVPSFEFKWDRY